MQLQERVAAFRSILVTDYKIAEADAVNIARHAELLVAQELDRGEKIAGLFKERVQLHPFIYVALAAIAGSLVTIAIAALRR